MLGFTKKRFFITLGLSVFIWVISIFIQFFAGINVKYSLFSGDRCQLTGFPIADCLYSSSPIPFWAIHAVNISMWFLIISLLATFLKRR